MDFLMTLMSIVLWTAGAIAVALSCIGLAWVVAKHPDKLLILILPCVALGLVWTSLEPEPCEPIIGDSIVTVILTCGWPEAAHELNDGTREFDFDQGTVVFDETGVIQAF